jgi:hypothetical protein
MSTKNISLFCFITLIVIFTSCGLERRPVCSVLIREVSEKWKQDTVGRLNYRSGHVRRFANCRVDAVDTGMVLKYLGRPNRQWSSGNRVEYAYWYYSGMHSGGWLYAIYFIFSFDAATMRLLHIGQADNDRG